MPIVKSKKEESDSMHPPGDDQFTPQKPKFSFNDLVLSDLIRNEIMDVLSIQQLQSHVFDTWGLANTHKLQKKIALNFYGEPGTGKTMAAHAVAHYLDKDIIEVNYADIESKYVGDTPKNLTRVFKKAKETNSVLFFDEADAMLSKRVTNMSSSTDTSVNQTRSVLLMLLNDFDGIIVFATNFVSNYDVAFMRRILGHVEFKLPCHVERTKIWNHLLPKDLPHNADVAKLAEKFDCVSGSDISNAILKAAFKAARNSEDIVCHDYFEHAIESIRHSKKMNLNIKGGDEKIEIRTVSKEYVESQVNI
ncbi:ATP-binding protein [Aeromonas caviae]|uniref:ATP-binding protein n=1 Tax=Aeromonas caviae TaxID=648 RepID=UPI002DB6F73F|nr:ATP-binding protein [Aeromonas caviae]MEB5776331.1 ATP-binding protein [Aeromonas caviae]MEB6651563.1 ATP-binding protein [Aeromonas caviae]